MEFVKSALGDGCSLETLEAWRLVYSLLMTGGTKSINQRSWLAYTALSSFLFCSWMLSLVQANKTDREANI